MKTKRLCWLVAVSVTVLGSAPALGQGEYVIFDLGRVGSMGNPHGINDAGMVVGAITNSYPIVRPVVWERSGGAWTQTELPIIAGTSSNLSGEALEVNASGQIVGWSVEAINWYPHTSTWQKVGGVWQVTDLGGESNLRSKGFDINDSGVVVGYKEVAVSTWDYRLTIWEGGVATNIGGSVSSGYGAQINSTDTRITARLGNPYHVAVWEKVSGIWQTPTDLGTLGGRYSEPTRMNDAGQIVGIAEDLDNNTFPFLYDGVVMQNLGTLGGGGGGAAGINDAGVIVGGAEISPGVSHAFIYQNDVMTDLNDLLPAGSGWVLTAAVDINNDGWIAGVGLLNGDNHTFVMYPAVSASGTIHFADYTGAVKVLVQVDLTRNGITMSQDVVIPAGGGSFNIPNLTAGTYDITFKACTWLPVTLTGVSVGSVDLPPITLTGGDGTGDGMITTADLSIVLTNLDEVGM